MRRDTVLLRRVTMVAALTVALVLWGLQSPRASAQLLLVNGKYRIVKLDKANQRVGVALPDANPHRVQNWVYLQANTKITVQLTRRGGWHKQEHLSYDGFFDTAKPGELMRVHGGRRWDGGITARKIWM